MPQRTVLERLDKHPRQLAKYFANTDASVGILTNGNEYEIYLDIVKANVMDEEPFFKFDLTESDEDDRRVIAQLARRADGSFDMEGLKGQVREWEIRKKYQPEAMRIFEGWRTRLDDEVVELVVRLLEKQLGPPEVNLGELVTKWFAEFVEGTKPKGPKNSMIPLPDWKITKKKDLPTKIIFPGKPEGAGIHNAYDVPVKTTEWLIDNDHLTRDSLPIRTSGRTILVSSDQDDFKQHHRPKRVSNVFVNSNFSAPKHVENAQTIIEHAGLDPRDLKGEFS